MPQFQLSPKTTAFYEERLLPLRRAYQKNPIQFLSKCAFWIALALMVIVLAKAAFVAFGRFTEMPPSLAEEVSKPKPTTKTESLPVPEMIAAHLFGSEEIKPKPATDASEDSLLSAPATSLSLTLKGVFTSNDKNGGSAIIATGEGDKKEDKFYKVGAVLPGPAILRQVYENRVVIEYQGRMESLWLYEPDDKATPKIQIRKEKEAGSKSPTSQVIDKRGDKALARTLLNYQHLLQTEPMQLLAVMRFLPSEHQGKMQGFRIGPGAKKEDFMALGLKENDIITAINGTALESPDKGMEVFEQLKNASEITIELQRGGQGLKLIYSVG